MSTGAAGFLNETDLYRLNSVTQNTLIRYPIDLIISSLRELFRKDSLYHNVVDPWGFNYVPDHTDLDPRAGLEDDNTTRVFISRSNRYDTIYYPAILVRSGSWRHVPISLNSDRHRVDYDTIKYVDGYGNEILVQEPSAFILSGAWEGSISIDVSARGIRERDDLVEIISIFLADLQWLEAHKAGVSIKPYGINISAPSDTTDDRNDKLFKQSITVDVRTEWRREIPIQNVVDAINICVDFVGDIEATPLSPAPNLTISTTYQYLDFLNTLE